MRKTMTMLFLVLLLLNTVIPVYSDSADDTAATEKTLIDNTIEPMSPAIHPCHPGKTHERCDIVIASIKRCGCSIYYLECCCGRIMAMFEDFCEKEQL